MTRAAKPAAHLAATHTWIAEPLDHEVAKALDRLARTEDVVQLAVLPDVHLAREVCVCVALATRSLLFPGAVGGDIGCGMAALHFDCGGDLLADRRQAARLMTELAVRIPITRHRQGSEHCARFVLLELDEMVAAPEGAKLLASLASPSPLQCGVAQGVAARYR